MKFVWIILGYFLFENWRLASATQALSIQGPGSQIGGRGVLTGSAINGPEKGTDILMPTSAGNTIGIGAILVPAKPSLPAGPSAGNSKAVSNTMPTIGSIPVSAGNRLARGTNSRDLYLL